MEMDEKPITREEILSLIPRYGRDSGKFGQPINDNYRDLERKLRWFTLPQHELRLIKKHLLSLKKAA